MFLTEDRKKNVFKPTVIIVQTLLSKLNEIIIATISPKDLRQSVEKYPDKVDLELYRISIRHQAALEKFVTRLNEKTYK